jgi:hypothetical protein
VLPGKTGEAKDGGGGGWRRTLGLGQRLAEAKKSMDLITMLERGVPLKVVLLYYLMEVHIYIWGAAYRKP